MATWRPRPARCCAISRRCWPPGGCGPDQVVRTTVYLVDLGDFARVNVLYADLFSEGVAPARACVQVAALPRGARVEIDAIALVA